MTEPSARPTWTCLEGSIAPEVVHAPKTCGDGDGTWSPVDWRNVRYLQHTVLGNPWANHLALVAAVMSARRYDARSVKLVMGRLHGRFKLLFKELSLHQMNELFLAP